MLTPDLRFHRVLAGAQEALDARVADHTVGPVAGRRVSNSPRPTCPSTTAAPETSMATRRDPALAGADEQMRCARSRSSRRWMRRRNSWRRRAGSGGLASQRVLSR